MSSRSETAEAASVIRYSFPWSAEADRGAVEGRKDRPCAMVVAARADAGQIRTIVAPITHSLPARRRAAAFSSFRAARRSPECGAVDIGSEGRRC